MNIDGFSLAPLVWELNRSLEGGRIDKIFQPDQYSLLVWVRQPGENLRLHISANPDRPKLLITTSSPENPAVAPSFCMLLRKHLEDGRIGSIEQHSLDRIVSINIDVRGERGVIITKRLVLEIMGKHSNIILTQNDTIIDAARRVGQNISRYRQVLPGKEYKYPPGQDRINILETSPRIFTNALIAAPSAGLAKAIIATGIGLGPVTAREIAWRAGLSPDISPDRLDEADIVELTAAVESLVKPIQVRAVQPTVVTENERPLALTAFFPEHLKEKTAHFFESMSLAIEYFDKFKGRSSLPEKDVLSKIVVPELARLTRKEAVLTEEAAQADNADSFRKCADILMANLYNINTGATEQSLPDIFSEDPSSNLITVSLDPDLTPLENAQRYYVRYNKAKRSREHLAAQLKECRQDILYLESITVSINHAETNMDYAEIRQELTNAGYIKAVGKRRLPTAQSEPISAKTSDGYNVLIGKNNRQNDFVTFKQARPDDIWLHTKNIPGSHVIIRAENRAISEQAIHEASQIAAFFSKGRQSANVPVDYTLRRYVKKPAGAKPGFVIYDHQSTVYITPDENMIQKLLNRQTP